MLRCLAAGADARNERAVFLQVRRQGVRVKGNGRIKVGEYEHEKEVTDAVHNRTAGEREECGRGRRKPHNRRFGRNCSEGYA